jgi:hypothetical protein
MDWTGIADRVLNPFRGPFHLTLADQVAMAKAPRLPDPRITAPPQPGGTTVRIESYPVGSAWDPAHHMFADYDDGRQHYIYRGGPGPDLAVHAQVTPADQSRDAGKGQRLLYERYLPGTSADQAVQAARRDADRINASQNPYLVGTSNSNSVIGGFTAKQFGHRVGDIRTPGYDYDIPDETIIPQWPQPY